MNILYCIQHQHSTMAQSSIIGICHDYAVFNEYGQIDVDWCFYEAGWAMQEPPSNFEDDLDMSWNEWIVVPSDEELIEMNSEVECFPLL